MSKVRKKYEFSEEPSQDTSAIMSWRTPFYLELMKCKQFPFPAGVRDGKKKTKKFQRKKAA